MCFVVPDLPVYSTVAERRRLSREDSIRCPKNAKTRAGPRLGPRFDVSAVIVYRMASMAYAGWDAVPSTGPVQYGTAHIWVGTCVCGAWVRGLFRFVCHIMAFGSALSGRLALALVLTHTRLSCPQTTYQQLTAIRGGNCNRPNCSYRTTLTFESSNFSMAAMRHNVTAT